MSKPDMSIVQSVASARLESRKAVDSVDELVDQQIELPNTESPKEAIAKPASQELSQELLDKLNWLPSTVVPINDLVPDHLNPRKGKVAELVASLKEFGQHRDLVVQAGTNRILIGNHMHKAALSLGWTHISVKYVPDNDVKAMRRALADNRIGQLGGWDDEVLAKVLEQTGTDVPGFDDKFIANLLKPKNANTVLEEPVMAIVPKLSESYHTIVIFAQNDIDWNFLETVFQLEKAKSYKNKATGKTVVITAEKFANLWRSRNA